jgi:hypothetical protein
MRPSKKTTANRLGSHALGAATTALGTAVRNLENARRIANFVRGKMEFEVRPSDVFVSSYPRSGTTLTQWLVYLLGHDASALPEHLTKASPWFERSLAIGELSAKDLERYESPRIFKSHLPREWLPDGARYVYVERDVQDVLVSYFHFYRSYLGFEGTFDDFYRRFMDGRVQYGSWFEHVEGWRARRGDGDILVVRYEQLLSERRAEAERIASFLNWDCDERNIARAVAESSFEAMKARESFFDHATALLLERGVRAESFLRAGKSGGGAGELSEAQAAELKERSAMGRRLAIRGLAAFLQ